MRQVACRCRVGRSLATAANLDKARQGTVVGAQPACTGGEVFPQPTPSSSYSRVTSQLCAFGQTCVSSGQPGSLFLCPPHTESFITSRPLIHKVQSNSWGTSGSLCDPSKVTRSGVTRLCYGLSCLSQFWMASGFPELDVPQGCDTAG